MFNLNRWIYYSPLVVALCFCLSATAQRKKSAILKYDTAARDGRVLMSDGTTLAGKVIFNDNDGVVTLYDEDGSHSFNSRRVAKFEMENAATGRNRVYYSLEFNDPETGMTDVDFFEILKELDSFAVLVRINRIKTESQTHTSPLYMGGTSPLLVDRASKKFTQTQTIYFLNGDGEFEPYLEIVEKELDGRLLDLNSTRDKYKEADLFEKYTGKHFQSLVEYAKEKDLSFKRKDDIMDILDRYEQLSKE